MELEQRIELAQSMLESRNECFITLPEVFDLDGTVTDHVLLLEVAGKIASGHAKGGYCAHFDGQTMLIQKQKWWEFRHRWRHLRREQYVGRTRG